jgi:hypothetical protein
MGRRDVINDCPIHAGGSKAPSSSSIWLPGPREPQGAIGRSQFVEISDGAKTRSGRFFQVGSDPNQYIHKDGGTAFGICLCIERKWPSGSSANAGRRNMTESG